MKVGMVIFRDSSDEVSVTLVSEKQFNRITVSYANLGAAPYSFGRSADNHVEFVRGIIEEGIIARCFQQTFCLEKLDWSEYDIVGIHTLPDY